MNNSTYDIIIIGGGIIGCSTAYNLMNRDRGLKLGVIEPDPSYSRASSTLSLANVRVQFSLKENIQISQYTQQVLTVFDKEMATDRYTPHISFRREGNLFLIDAKREKIAKQALSLQQELGCSVHWWPPEEIKSRYSIYRTEGLIGGTFGDTDGHVDPHAFLRGYRTKADVLGATFIEDEVTRVITQAGCVSGVQLASGKTLKSKVVVNCAGAWAGIVARTAGVDIPVEPVKRQVFVFDPAVKPKGPLPLTFLPSGLYFRTETGGTIVIGKSMEKDPKRIEFSWDEKRFTEVLWPELAEFAPTFDTLKLLRGWAGLYAVNRLDGNAILGEWPTLKGFFLANGFSGHGLQQAPAVGRYLSELILGIEPALDLSVFHPERILDNRPVSEAGLV
ncbi:MAG: FAD-binding oxidoreductase [Deltaproteobacteria bacterium]|nr:FAD-binding oxidoreductase [Deltaproteobacteria bacterium]MBW1962139.1 FAD-binding oxidoreductase [Deltaproteobacteria bacterium]MBW2152700.1 FAD-binding oxidoreductase [Deltaproteobacteria bacterium]